MKLKLFGSADASSLTLSILHGGYDSEVGRVVLIVRNDSLSGTLSLDVSESRALLSLLNTNVPTIEKVEAA
jgi:hypothetical protein